eukprot:CAMPEP_0206379298 /NCGR_PEP_ID=MMETSP0294-20121207/11265_1 /ASSEMBLY_ACC=CAM_ASM_000327 /TAXON_ID=39354 /ORGANISM="Heterosigma akashiwo, Strain CCMP2393" /LENGTH=138 /DNA_ID=CAMNT_0053828129 /DNA_START=47 /DNA_END=459 /DNA_ORIENTATION=-
MASACSSTNEHTATGSAIPSPSKAATTPLPQSGTRSGVAASSSPPASPGPRPITAPVGSVAAGCPVARPRTSNAAEVVRSREVSRSGMSSTSLAATTEDYREMVAQISLAKKDGVDNERNILKGMEGVSLQRKGPNPW